ncbi:MAG: hypothetical protein II877_08630 [Synergistaceae bacterium]|nr:hypothetical protein [Synergistaceae bacterium]
MKSFTDMKKHECVNAFFAVNSFTVNELVVKELLIPAIIAVMIREAVCE